MISNNRQLERAFICLWQHDSIQFGLLALFNLKNWHKALSAPEVVEW